MIDKIFEVISKDKPDDAAYSSDDLILHMDQGYFESSPGIQALHCIKSVSLHVL